MGRYIWSLVLATSLVAGCTGTSDSTDDTDTDETDAAE